MKKGTGIHGDDLYPEDFLIEFVLVRNVTDSKGSMPWKWLHRRSEG